MPPKQIPGQAHPTVAGAIDGVPCPHCGKKNDLRNLESEQLLDTGHQMFCDYCQRSMEVVSMRVVKVITVRKTVNPVNSFGRGGQVARRQPQPQQRPQPQQQGIGGMVQRLLGRGPKR